MKIGLFFHMIYQFEPDTGQNTQDRCAYSLDHPARQVRLAGNIITTDLSE